MDINDLLNKFLWLGICTYYIYQIYFMIDLMEIISGNIYYTFFIKAIENYTLMFY